MARRLYLRFRSYMYHNKPPTARVCRCRPTRHTGSKVSHNSSKVESSGKVRRRASSLFFRAGEGARDSDMPDTALDVDVPPALVEGLKSELRLELSQSSCQTAVEALGGDPWCFERFLIARQLNVGAAASMFRSTLEFRHEHVARLMPIDPSIRSLVGGMWPAAYCGRTAGNRPRPVQIVLLGDVDPKAMMAKVTEEQFRTFYVHWMELALRHQRACGNAQQVEVYDLKGLSFSQLYVPGIRMLARVFKIGQAHYPENLRQCVIINAPHFFTIAWAIVSRVLDARTRAKTRIISDDGAACLEEVLGLDQAQRQALFERVLSKNADEQEGLPWLGTAVSPVLLE